MEFLNWERDVFTFLQLGFGFFAAVTAIVLWSRTREGGWLFIILATLLSYLDVLFRFMDRIGLVSEDLWTWEGLSLLRLGFTVFVPVLYALGFLAATRKLRRP